MSPAHEAQIMRSGMVADTIDLASQNVSMQVWKIGSFYDLQYDIFSKKKSLMKDLVCDVLAEAAAAGVWQGRQLHLAARGILLLPGALVERVRHDSQRVGWQALPVLVARDHRDVVQRERLQPRHVERRG